MSREYQTYIETRLGPVFTLSRKMYPETEERLDMPYRVAENEEHPDYAAVSGVIYSLLTSFLSEKNTVGSAQKSAEAIRRAAAYITENYSRNITTKEIADAAFLSRSYMSELFVQTYGMPPHEYLVIYRLSHVKERLLNTGISVSEIAESTGFRDVFTLSRVFKQKFGISPSEYRKQMLE
jgi:AraC-like DNA-binding protein